MSLVRSGHYHQRGEPVTPETSPPDPGVILDLLEAFRRSKTMFAAVSLGIFDTLERARSRLAELAEDARTPPRRARAPARRLRRLQLSNAGATPNENTPAASAYLCKRSPSRLTGYINYSNNMLWKLWANLEDAVREGTHRWQQTFGWDGPIFSASSGPRTTCASS